MTRKHVLVALYAVATLCGVANANDAEEMQSEEMNPGATLTTRERIGGGSFKVLVYGNSIALHGPYPEIGWTNDWGMAASARDKDFAHLVVAGLESQLGERADYRIRNLALLERNFTTNLSDFTEIAADVAWAPDYVVLAIGVPTITEETADDYTEFLRSLARPLAESAGHPAVVMRSPFWRNSAKAACTAQAARDVGATYIDAGPLGDDDSNKAIGLFAHAGIQNHPGDLGMRRLADIILTGFASIESWDDWFILTPGWDAATASRRNSSTARSPGADIATGAIRSESTFSDLEARYRTFYESEPANLRSDEWHGTIISIY